MEENIKNFLLENKKELIENNIEQVYKNFETSPIAIYDSEHKCREITQALLDIGVNPLNSMREIPSHYLSFSEDIKSIIIPNNIEKINSCAFFRCKNLENVTLSNNIKEISRAAFYGCTSLTRLILPNSLEKIGDTAFYHLQNVKEITIPKSVLYIGNRAFGNNDQMSLRYLGTKEEWQAIKKENMITGYSISYVLCSDGLVSSGG